LMMTLMKKAITHENSTTLENRSNCRWRGTHRK
jgi:hypothetical protein